MPTPTREPTWVTLPGVPASVPEARRFVLRLAAAAGLDAEVHEALAFLVSEVVTNAVLHARSSVTVRCTTAPAGVLVEVADLNPLIPLPRRHDAEAVSGRGLEMLELVAAAFGVAPTPPGKTVWFTLGSVECELPAGWPAPAEVDLVPVTLLSVPLELSRVSSQHDEALLREYELVQLGSAASSEAREWVASAARARLLVADAVTAVADEQRGQRRRQDVRLQVPRSAGPAFDVLRLVLDAAEQAAAAGALLTRPALPELVDLRTWAYSEVRRQLDGGEPSPWSPSTAPAASPAVPTVDTDLRWVQDVAEPVVVADDTNHIVAASPAAVRLFGWDPADLVGQRVTALVPDRFREDHLTGFTRQQVTGRTQLIGREVRVPGLRRDGQEIDVGLRLEHRSVGNRSLFVAWFSG